MAKDRNDPWQQGAYFAYPYTAAQYLYPMRGRFGTYKNILPRYIAPKKIRPKPRE